MQIKNYTSRVPAHETIAEIERKLAASGASGIMKNFGPTGLVTSLIFKIDLDKRTFTIRVPANVQNCFEALWIDYCKTVRRPKESTKGAIMEQAERTAWKIVQEWIEIQLSMIRMRQAQFLEVFMPYIYDGKQTFFEYHDTQKFKALPQSTT